MSPAAKKSAAPAGPRQASSRAGAAPKARAGKSGGAAGDIAAHFTKREPAVQATYRALLAAARRLGPVTEEAKKTSIHLVRKTAFAGVATRKAALVVTLKADADIANARIVAHQQTSAHRWHLDVKLLGPKDVDAQFVGWLRHAYALAE